MGLRPGDHGDGSCDLAQNLLVCCITKRNAAAEIAAELITGTVPVITITHRAFQQAEIKSAFLNSPPKTRYFPLLGRHTAKKCLNLK